MKAAHRCFQLCLSFIFCLTLPALAAEKAKKSPTDEVYGRLRTEYMRLRNTDIDVAKTKEWENLAERFDAFARQNEKFEHTPFALYQGSILYEQLYRKVGGLDRLEKAIALLDRLVKRHPASEIADDALVRRGDLLLYDLDRPADAQQMYKQVVTDFPNSDMREAARIRLRSIQTGEYRAASELSAAEAEDRKGRKILVVLDPGHGGEDFGATGPGNLLEKDVSLSLALEIEKLLTENPLIGVRLTRRRDVFVPLAERIQFANDFEADLFVSLHTNASPAGKLSGVETYYLDNSGDEGSRLLAERENAGFRSGTAEGDLQFMLGDLIQNAKLDESIALAHLVQRSLVNHMRGRYESVKDLGVRKAPFYVLVGAHMPCVLVESFFIDHSVEGVQLAKREFRREIAAGIRQGIVFFLNRRGLLKAAK